MSEAEGLGDAYICTTTDVSGGYPAADVLAMLQHAKDDPLRTSPFVDAPRMRSAVWMEPGRKTVSSLASNSSLC